MDPRFQNLDFSANYSSNAFNKLGDSMQSGYAGEWNTDTILRLDSLGSSLRCPSTSIGVKRKRFISGCTGQQFGSSLSLGFPSSSSSDSKGSSGTACTAISSAKETDEETSVDLDLDFTLHLGTDKVPTPKKNSSFAAKADESKHQVDLELSLSTGPAESEITNVCSPTAQSGKELPLAAGVASNADEGSTSSRWKSATRLLPLHSSMPASTGFFLNPAAGNVNAVSVSKQSSSVITVPNSSVTCTSGITKKLQLQHRTSTKTCQVEGCGKGARGASGRCISHGGGRRCQKLGCHKGAEGRTVFCKAHGGGRRCEFLGCTKSAEGRTDFCIAHGGGRRCTHEGCTRAARGKSGLCIRHGGGKRCQKENCTRSAEGLSGLCISHGGGRRCQFMGCTKGAQGSTMFCKAHGGGKRCTYPGCTKGAEGSTPFCKGHGGGKRCSFQGGGICTKSVHGGTNFCVAHGGGKRCAVPECTKSARGRTDYCVRHGGGKRCRFEGCGKSAQGSTDFCKAHGGGKRCSWGHPGSEYASQNTGPCSSFARGKTGLCAFHNGLVQDKRVHGGIIGPMVQAAASNLPEKMNESTVVDNMNVENMNAGRSEMTLSRSAYSSLKQNEFPLPNTLAGEGVVSSISASAPEGRVHGGSLMALVAGGLSLGPSSSKSTVPDPSEPGNSYMMPPGWM